MDKSAFLTQLKTELTRYYSLPESDKDVKRDRKAYISGFMGASRFFGVTFEELQEVTDSAMAESSDESSTKMLDEYIDVPTYIRHGIKR